MSETLKQELLQGIASMSLAIQEQAADKLIEYVSLLEHWNKSYNLTAIRNTHAMISLHLLDSLSVLPYLGDGDVIDVGSGAGLPGIPLALAKPEQRFVLNDANGKKTRFLTQAKIVLALDNVEVVNSRIEKYQPERTFDVVIARAYASTDDIIETTRHLHTDRGRLLVMQGKLDETLDDDGYQIQHAHVLKVPGLEADRHLLDIRRRLG